jgi:hypothetical protein
MQTEKADSPPGHSAEAPDTGIQPSRRALGNGSIAIPLLAGMMWFWAVMFIIGGLRRAPVFRSSGMFGDLLLYPVAAVATTLASVVGIGGVLLAHGLLPAARTRNAPSFLFVAGCIGAAAGAALTIWLGGGAQSVWIAAAAMSSLTLVQGAVFWLINGSNMGFVARIPALMVRGLAVAAVLLILLMLAIHVR